MSTHPAYPSKRTLRVECAAERIAGRDIAAGHQLRDALLTCADAIRDLKFVTACPSAWGNLADIVATLEDMAPSDDALMDRDITALALEKAEELVA